MAGRVREYIANKVALQVGAPTRGAGPARAAACPGLLPGKSNT